MKNLSLKEEKNSVILAAGQMDEAEFLSSAGEIQLKVLFILEGLGLPVEIKDEASKKDVLAKTKEAKALAKDVDQISSLFIQPHRQAIQKIGDACRMVKTPVDEFLAKCRDMVSSYNKMVEELKRAEEKRIEEEKRKRKEQFGMFLSLEKRLSEILISDMGLEMLKEKISKIKSFQINSELYGEYADKARLAVSEYTIKIQERIMMEKERNVQQLQRIIQEGLEKKEGIEQERVVEVFAIESENSMLKGNLPRVSNQMVLVDFEVLDLESVPKEYLIITPNTTLIKKALREGVVIPGIKRLEKKVPVLS